MQIMSRRELLAGLWAGIALTALGCSGAPSAAGADAGLDASDLDGGLYVTPPTPPALPVLTPCPDGWREVPPPDGGDVATCDPWPDGMPVSPPAPPVLTPCPDGWREVASAEGDHVTCDPWPAGAPQDCAADEAHFPGEAGCSRIGTACPVGDWADGLPETGVLYVKAGAPVGGDGTQATPFGTIAAAMSAATPGTVIALSKGTFDEAVRPSTGVTIWGACVAQTVLSTSVPALWATVDVADVDVTLRNVQVGGRRPGIYARGSSGSVHLEDVLIANTTYLGWHAFGGALATGRGVVVRDTQANESDGTSGVGLNVSEGARVEVVRGVFERNRTAAVNAYGIGTSVTLADVAIRDTQSQDSDDRQGVGLAVHSGAQTEATRTVIELSRTGGVLADSVGTVLRLTDTVIRDTQSRDADGYGGVGLQAQQGAQVEVRRAAFQRNHAAGLAAMSSGTTVELTDTVVCDTQGQQSDGQGGIGLMGQSGAQVEVNRALFARNSSSGVSAEMSGTALWLTDVVVGDTQSQQSDRSFGMGLAAVGGAVVDVARAVFSRNRSAAVAAGPGAATVKLTDVVLSDTKGQEIDGRLGIGLSAIDGAVVEVTRAMVERNRMLGVSAAGTDTTVTLTEVVVRDTEGQESNQFLGNGLSVIAGAQAQVARALFARKRAIGVVAGDPGSSLKLEDVVVRSTLSQATDRAGGVGLEVVDGPQVDVTRGVFEQNRMAGVYAAVAGATVSLTDVVVRDTQSQENDGDGGGGLTATLGAQVVVSRGVFERNRDRSVVVFDPTTMVTLTDVVVRDTQSQESDALGGTGLQAAVGSHVEVTRGVFERNRAAGVNAFGEGTTVKLADVVVRDTLGRDCAATTCVGFGAGSGLGVYGGANLEMTRFQAEANAQCGLQLAYGSDPYGQAYLVGGTMDLHGGEVSHNAVCGANVQSEGFDVARLTDRVVWRDNTTNLDTRGLPVPQASPPLGITDGGV